MSSWELVLVLLYSVLNLFAFRRGLLEVRNKKNNFGLAGNYSFLGIFVWADAIVIAPFWLLSSIAVIILQDWYLFLLIVSVFWVVRSAGEVIYWICEQFSGKNRNPPQSLKYYKFFGNDAIWFIYQIFWQCALVVSIITSIYLTAVWLRIRF